jgi:DNA-directed RNA polymerase specialized sigma24 family protein
VQIAEIVGCGEPTVRSRLRLGRNRLAELVLADPFFSEEVEP